MSILAYRRSVSTPRTQRHPAWRAGDVVWDSDRIRWDHFGFAHTLSLAGPDETYEPTSYERRWWAENAPSAGEGHQVVGLAPRPAWFRSLGLIPAELGAALAPR